MCLATDMIRILYRLFVDSSSTPPAAGDVPAAYRGLPGVSHERLRKGKRHRTIRVSIFGIFAYRTAGGRDQRVGRGKIRVRQLLRDHVSAIDAGLFAVAMGEAVDSE